MTVVRRVATTSAGVRTAGGTIAGPTHQQIVRGAVGATLLPVANGATDRPAAMRTEAVIKPATREGAMNARADVLPIGHGADHHAIDRLAAIGVSDHPGAMTIEAALRTAINAVATTDATIVPPTGHGEDRRAIAPQVAIGVTDRPGAITIVAAIRIAINAVATTDRAIPLPTDHGEDHRGIALPAAIGATDRHVEMMTAAGRIVLGVDRRATTVAAVPRKDGDTPRAALGNQEG